MAGQRKGGRLGLALGVLVLVVLLVAGVGWWLSRENPTSPIGEPPTESPGEPERTQPADCPDVSLISVPGTWESAADDDPYNPQANPNSLLTKVTAPLAEANDPARVEVYTVPYTAQFRNPQLPEDVSYNDSRAEGTEKLRDKIAATHDHCPFTKYALLGFSQGAVIAGDVTSEIGNGDGVVPPDLVLGTVLIADGRRDQGAIGPGLQPTNGQGMEISLQGASGLTELIADATMTGPRPGGFGALTEQTASLCAGPDLICNAPMDAAGGAARLSEFLNNNAVHAEYDTNPNVVEGTTATEWSRQHLQSLIDSAEEVPHS